MDPEKLMSDVQFLNYGQKGQNDVKSQVYF